MPGLVVGNYPAELAAGLEISSTYEGRHVTVREDELIHPFIADGFVNKGDQVVFCRQNVPATYRYGVGVAFNDGAAVADLIAIDTEGIWMLQCCAFDDNGNSAIEIGEPLYIRAGGLAGTTPLTGLGDAEISKRRNLVTQIPFGYALGRMAAGSEGTICVKVHWDPRQPFDEYALFQVGNNGGVADNAMSLRLRNESTITTGYERAMYIRHDQDGIKTGDAEVDVLGLEMFVNAAVPVAHNLSLYTEIDGNQTIGRLTGFEIYHANRGNAVGADYMVMLGRNSNAVLTGPGNDAFIYFREHSTVQQESSVLMLQGNNAAEYLVVFGSNPDTGLLLLETSAAASDTNYRVRCNTTAGVRWLHLHGS